MKMKQLFPWHIEITASVNGGIIVRVGCAQLTYGGSRQEIKRFLADARSFLEDPKKAEKEYNQMSLKSEIGPPQLNTGPIDLPDPDSYDQPQEALNRYADRQQQGPAEGAGQNRGQ